jgi:Fe2+ transport system protein B
MSFNARLSVYVIFASVFLRVYETTVIFSLDLLGICLAFIIGLLINNTLFKKDEGFL